MNKPSSLSFENITIYFAVLGREVHRETTLASCADIQTLFMHAECAEIIEEKQARKERSVRAAIPRAEGSFKTIPVMESHAEDFVRVVGEALKLRARTIVVTAA